MDDVVDNDGMDLLVDTVKDVERDRMADIVTTLLGELDKDAMRLAVGVRVFPVSVSAAPIEPDTLCVVVSVVEFEPWSALEIVLVRVSDDVRLVLPERVTVCVSPRS